MDDYLAGMQLMQGMMGPQEYPNLEAEMAAVCLEEADTCIICLHNTIAQHIVTRPIQELYLEEERR